MQPLVLLRRKLGQGVPDHPMNLSFAARMTVSDRTDPLLAPAANDWNRERRETGNEQMVRVHHDEGAAIHIGPESCAGGREAVREALTGECAGQPPAFAGAGY